MSSCVSAFICSVATEANCRKESSPQLKIMVNTQKKIIKIIDAFEEKTVREMDKMMKCFDKVRQEVTKRTEAIENSFRQLRRHIAKLCEAGDDSETDTNEEEEDDWYPPELYRPIQFVQDYVMSDEYQRPVPFAMHYLEARFGDHYRGNRSGQCWRQKDNGKYVTCKFEDVMSKLGALQYQFRACFVDPSTYKDLKDPKDNEYFTRLNKWWKTPKTVDNQNLDATVLKKFLYYKHKNLPSVRSK